MFVGTQLARSGSGGLAVPRTDFLVFCAESTAEEGADVEIGGQYLWFKKLLMHNLYQQDKQHYLTLHE